MIEDVVITPLTTHADERGFFREILRENQMKSQQKFGQWSHAVSYEGVIKAWHLHAIQTDWWYCVSGVLRVGLCDRRENSPTHGETMDFLIGDNQSAQVIEIPPGVAHGYKVIQGPVHFMYITSHEYNPDDELRIPYDDPSIDFDWLKRAPIT